MKILQETDIARYTFFLENNERCNFQQSLEWQKVKSNWQHEVVLSENENGEIVGAISVLIRKFPIFGNFMYISRGPICDIHDETILKDLFYGLKDLAKKYNAFTLKMEPDILSSDEEFKKIVKKLGFEINENVKTFAEAIQPRYVFRLNIKGKTEDEVFANFHQKTRYNIRVATKKGVVIKEGTKENLKEFHKIMEVTGARDDFMIRPLKYFERMYDELAPKHLKLIMAYYEDKPISGIIDINYGNKIWYLYGASSNEHRNLMPNYLLQWEMIKQAISEKKDIYDFRGVCGIVDETHPQYGLYRFKKGFGADFTEFIGEIYINFKPVTYKAYKVTEKIYKNLADLKTKIRETVASLSKSNKK